MKLTASLAMVAALAAVASGQTLINGQGATFPDPIYTKWFSEYKKLHSDVQINYTPTGSGAGIKAVTDGTADFGASDAIISDEQLKAYKDKHGFDVLAFPTVMGAVVATYNIKGVSASLNLTGPVLADIYLGKITKWNDPALAKLNPGVTLPEDDITPCHRSDGSGTTYIFSDYLSKVSPDWAKTMGKSTSLKWSGGLGGKGNEGVTALLQQTPGAIGYIELVYALNNHITFADLKNHEGNFVTASLNGVTAAGDAAARLANRLRVDVHMPAEFRVSITDAPGGASYPISSFTYLLVYRQQTDKAKGQQIIDFLKWALHDGQQYGPALQYAPLPAPVVALEDKQVNEIRLPK